MRASGALTESRHYSSHQSTGPSTPTLTIVISICNDRALGQPKQTSGRLLHYAPGGVFSFSHKPLRLDEVKERPLYIVRRRFSGRPPGRLGQSAAHGRPAEQ